MVTNFWSDHKFLSLMTYSKEAEGISFQVRAKKFHECSGNLNWGKEARAIGGGA